MKLLLVLSLLLGFQAKAGYTKGYFRRGGYVKPHFTKKLPKNYKGFKK